MTTSPSPSSRSDASAARLRLARGRRGLTKSALAALLGSSVDTVTRYERMGAPAADLSALARALEVEESFLTLHDPDEVGTTEVRFRALARATQRQRTAACAAGVSGIELYQWLAARFRLPGVVLPEMDGADPATAADAVRAAWGQGAGALPNLLQLCEAHGIRVLSLPPIAHAVDAYSLWRDERPYVFLSTMKSAERSRFDLAHELGHLVLHSRGHDGDLEREADRFAAALLMPAELLLGRVGTDLAVPKLLRLRSRYGVAATAMLRRLHELGAVSDAVYRQDCVVLAQRGFRSAEPGGLARERSRVFDQTLEHLRASDGALHRMAEELGLTGRDLHDLTFGQFLLPLPGGGRGDDGARGHLRAV